MNQDCKYCGTTNGNIEHNLVIKNYERKWKCLRCNKLNSLQEKEVKEQ